MIIHIPSRVATKLHLDLRLLVVEPHPQCAVEAGIQMSVGVSHLTLQRHHAHGMKHNVVGSPNRHSIDFRHSDIPLRQGETHHRVAQKQEADILIKERTGWALIIERVALGLPDNIAITHRFARSVALKEDWDKRPCQTVVMHTVSRTTCCKHRHTASMGVQEQLFTSRNQEGVVVFCKLTSGGIDKGQFLVVVEGVDVGIGKHILTCQALDATMAVIEEGQSALFESTHQIGIGALVDGTTRSACQRIGATIHLFCGQCRTNGIHHHIMFLAVIHIIHLLVVGQEEQIRLPFAMRFSQIVVMFDLAQHILRFLHGRNRDTTYTDIDTTFTVHTFVVVHQCEEVVGCETQLILWVFKRFVSRHIILPIAFDIAEIERCTSKQGQILQLASAAPIHHANEVAYACRVGRA